MRRLDGGANGGDDGGCSCGGAGAGSRILRWTYTLKVQSDIVLTNVVVRDKKTGEVVKGLKASDFTILENGKPQKIESFDYQNVDEAAVLREKATVLGKATIADLVEQELCGEDPEQLRDHRLIVMFFDLSSMQPEDIDRAVEVGAGLCEQEDAARGSGCAGEHGHWAEHGPGLYLGQGCVC